MTFISKLYKVMFSQSFLPIWTLVLIISIFFAPSLAGRIPISTGVMVTSFYPFNSSVTSPVSNHLNMLTTDPVRQLYVWRKFAVDQLKSGQIPWWNPYNLSGTPMIANFQSAVFYPLNIIFWLINFPTAWSLLVASQQLLGGLFMYLYLRHRLLSPWSCLFGSLTWIFSGFFIGWLEWNTLVHTIIWTPLILLSIDHVFAAKSLHSHKSILLRWQLVLAFSLSAQFLAGSPAPWAYLSLVQVIYLFLSSSSTPLVNKLTRLIFPYLLFTLFILPQLTLTTQFTNLSNRQADLGNPLYSTTWFLPYKNIVQLIIPDFFGNPAHNNYWGVFNYAEFVSFIGIIPAFFVVYLLFHKNHYHFYTLFFFFIAAIGFIFATKNPISVWQIKLDIPIINTSNASRWIVLSDFSLAILSAYGFEQFVHHFKLKPALITTFIITGTLTFVWAIVLNGKLLFFPSPLDRNATIRSLLIPTINLGVLIIALIIQINQRPFPLTNKLKQKFHTQLSKITLYHHLYPFPHLSLSNITSAIILVTLAFTSLSFATNYTDFSVKSTLYPSTSIISYLQNHQNFDRYLCLDLSILPANINMAYGLYSLEGYDSLYINDYGRLISMSPQREIPQKSPSFMRSLFIHDYRSPAVNLLAGKYILSINSLPDDNLTLLLQEGYVKLYQNNLALPRAFITSSTAIPSKDEVIAATINTYQPNFVRINTHQTPSGYLVLSDSYYPGWSAILDGQPVTVTNWNGLRATIVPEGDHELIYQYRYPHF